MSVWNRFCNVFIYETGIEAGVQVEEAKIILLWCKGLALFNIS